jgi:hypothetical protein
VTCSKCHRPATKQAFFLGRWVALCRYHIGAYYDLPQRPAVAARQTVLQRFEPGPRAPDLTLAVSQCAHCGAFPDERHGTH